MKKVFIVLLLAIALLSMGSCKKWYYCTCMESNGTVNWEGDIEATSKAKAESILAKDCSFTATCE
jgi:hypothetical protein